MNPTKQQLQSIDIMLPAAIAGYMYYKTFFGKNSKENFQYGAIAAIVVFACAYVVVSQATNLLFPGVKKTVK